MRPEYYSVNQVLLEFVIVILSPSWLSSCAYKKKKKKK